MQLVSVKIKDIKSYCKPCQPCQSVHFEGTQKSCFVDKLQVSKINTKYIKLPHLSILSCNRIIFARLFD